MTVRRAAAALVLAFVAGLSRAAHARELAPGLEVYGYFQEWLTLWEEMEIVGGAVQPASGDSAADTTMGFRLAAARVGLRASTGDDRFGVGAQVRLEEQPGVLELWGRLRVHEALVLYAGQMKIPSTWENLEESSDLDFLTRPRITEVLGDYALARTVYTSSLFGGIRSAQRDLGVAVRGEVRPGGVGVRYFGMVSNGLGSNLYIGGDTTREFVLTNHPFDLFYGARLEVEPVRRALVFGGHASINRHDDMAASGGHAVVDLHRVTWSADARLDLARIGLRAAVLYGGGRIDDDPYATGKTDLEIQGWEGRVVWQLNPLLRRLIPCGPWDDHVFEVALRYDGMRSEANEAGVVVRQDTVTPGLAYEYRDALKIQLDTFLRWTRDPTQTVPDNDAVILGAQVRM